MIENPRGVDTFPLGSPDEDDLFWQRNLAGVLQATAAAILVVITVAYTYVAFLQWQAIQESVGVSKIAADAAKTSADLALSEARAWLTVQRFELTGQLSATEERQIRVRLINSGKTPAFLRSHSVSIILAANEDGWDRSPPVSPTQVTYAIPPGSWFGEISGPVSVTQEQLNIYQAKKYQLYVRVILSYHDFSSKIHETEVCGHYRFGEHLSQGFVACQGFHRMD